eukprot:2459805-Rhodomonas_salina.2
MLIGGVLEKVCIVIKKCEEKQVSSSMEIAAAYKALLSRFDEMSQEACTEFEAFTSFVKHLEGMLTTMAKTHTTSTKTTQFLHGMQLITEANDGLKANAQGDRSELGWIKQQLNLGTYNLVVEAENRKMEEWRQLDFEWTVCLFVGAKDKLVHVTKAYYDMCVPARLFMAYANTKGVRCLSSSPTLATMVARMISMLPHMLCHLICQVFLGLCKATPNTVFLQNHHYFLLEDIAVLGGPHPLVPPHLLPFRVLEHHLGVSDEDSHSLVELILEDEEGPVDAANAMVPELEVLKIQTCSMTSEPSQGGSDVVVTDNVSQPAIQEQPEPERYKPEQEPEQQQPVQQSNAASKADSDDFRLKPSH